MKEAVIEYSCYDLDSSEIKKMNAVDPVYTSAKALQEALITLGFHSGIKVVVHSSLGSLGSFEGGAQNLCRLLMDLVTPDGVLMMPGLVKYPSDNEEYVYIPEKTPVSVGIIPDVFRQMPDVVRSLDPTHSFCVWGKDKLRYVKDHHKLPTMHRNNPLGLLEQDGGYCLLIGCYTKTTFMHVVETACGAHCLGSRTEVYPAVINGEQVMLRGWGWRNGECHALRHDDIFGDMRKRSALKECMLGRSHLMLFRLADYRESYSKLLLDADKGCRNCSVMPRVVAQSVPSDWDFENDCLTAGDAFVNEVF